MEDITTGEYVEFKREKLLAERPIQYLSALTKHMNILAQLTGIVGGEDTSIIQQMIPFMMKNV